MPSGTHARAARRNRAKAVKAARVDVLEVALRAVWIWTVESPDDIPALVKILKSADEGAALHSALDEIEARP